MHGSLCPILCPSPGHTARIALHALTCLPSLASWIKCLGPACAFVGQHQQHDSSMTTRWTAYLPNVACHKPLPPQVNMMSSSTYSTTVHQHSPCSRRKVFNGEYSWVIIITWHDGTYSSPADSAPRPRACTTRFAPLDVSLSSNEGGIRLAYRNACHESFSHHIMRETFITG